MLFGKGKGFYYLQIFRLPRFERVLLLLPQAGSEGAAAGAEVVAEAAPDGQEEVPFLNAGEVIFIYGEENVPFPYLGLGAMSMKLSLKNVPFQLLPETSQIRNLR